MTSPMPSQRFVASRLFSQASRTPTSVTWVPLTNFMEFTRPGSAKRSGSPMISASSPLRQLSRLPSLQASQPLSCLKLRRHLGWKTYPPRLSQEAAQELIDDFKTNYPGELLDEDTMPSIRLLSLVQHSLKPGEKIRWIPWQFRLSSKQYTEIMEAKSSKPMRTEAQLLASALYDDTPEMPVAHLRLSASWLSRIQTVYRNAWTLCGAAHLNNLKALIRESWT